MVTCHAGLLLWSLIQGWISLFLIQQIKFWTHCWISTLVSGVYLLLKIIVVEIVNFYCRQKSWWVGNPFPQIICSWWITTINIDFLDLRGSMFHLHISLVAQNVKRDWFGLFRPYTFLLWFTIKSKLMMTLFWTS